MMKSTGIISLAALVIAGCGSDDPVITPPAKINLRVAHLSPNAPAVDFCVKLGSGAFTGPVLKSLGATSGLAYPQVTKYLTLDAGQYTARLVAPNAADCNTSLASLPDYAFPSLPDGTYATAAAVGLVGGTPAFTVRPFVDKYTSSAGKADLRFIHASPGTPAVDVGVGSGTAFTPIFSNVSFPDTTHSGFASGTGIDSGGFFATAPLSGVTVSARATGTTADALVVPGVSLAAGQTATVFAVGILSDTAKPLKALVCVDNGAPAGNLSACSLLP